MIKDKKFNDLIFKSFSESEQYEKIKHGMNKARALMLQHLPFKNASVSHQYDMCMTIYIIGTQSATKAIHNFRIIAKPEERVFKYALDEGFEPLNTLYLSDKKSIY